MSLMKDNDFRAELRTIMPVGLKDPGLNEEELWGLMVRFGWHKKARAFAEVTEMADVKDMTVDGLKGWAALRAAGLAQEKETHTLSQDSKE